MNAAMQTVFDRFMPAYLQHHCLSPDQGSVCAHIRDCRTEALGGQHKTLSLSGKELIRRFLQHVLPKGFMRIHHIGFLTNRCRAAKPEQIRQALRAPAPSEPDGDEKKLCGEKATLCTDVRPCPRCHQPQWRAIALVAPKRFKGG